MTAGSAGSPKVVILAGGRGTRIGEESYLRPKPMIEVGGRPILWHIMKIYSHYGLHDFIVCLGYKGEVIKEYFMNYRMHRSDITVDLVGDHVEFSSSKVEPWRITLVDTGERTMTGGRVKRIAHLLPSGEPFCLTYGDGVGNVDVTGELDFHRSHGRVATMTVVRPPARYGNARIADGRVVQFTEKAQADAGQISGGFFVLQPEVMDLIDGDSTTFEAEPLEQLAERGQLVAWEHDGFWHPMDTMRDRDQLEQLWASGEARWKVWDD
jgi:glucose-1-phosphate cytidylyltransferase